jgi:hypothetical protein
MPLSKTPITLFYGATDQDTSSKKVQLGDMVLAENVVQIKGGEFSKRAAFVADEVQTYEGQAGLDPDSIISPDGTQVLTRDATTDHVFARSATTTSNQDQGNADRFIPYVNTRIPALGSGQQEAPRAKQAGNYIVWMLDDQHFQIAQVNPVIAAQQGSSTDDAETIVQTSEVLSVLTISDASSLQIKSFAVIDHQLFDPNNLYIFWVDWSSNIWAYQVPHSNLNTGTFKHVGTTNVSGDACLTSICAGMVSTTNLNPLNTLYLGSGGTLNVPPPGVSAVVSEAFTGSGGGEGAEGASAVILSSYTPGLSTWQGGEVPVTIWLRVTNAGSYDYVDPFSLSIQLEECAEGNPEDTIAYYGALYNCAEVTTSWQQFTFNVPVTTLGVSPTDLFVLNVTVGGDNSATSTGVVLEMGIGTSMPSSITLFPGGSPGATVRDYLAVSVCGVLSFHGFRKGVSGLTNNTAVTTSAHCYIDPTQSNYLAAGTIIYQYIGNTGAMTAAACTIASARNFQNDPTTWFYCFIGNGATGNPTVILVPVKGPSFSIQSVLDVNLSQFAPALPGLPADWSADNFTTFGWFFDGQLAAKESLISSQFGVDIAATFIPYYLNNVEEFVAYNSDYLQTYCLAYVVPTTGITVKWTKLGCCIALGWFLLHDYTESSQTVGKDYLMTTWVDKTALQNCYHVREWDTGNIIAEIAYGQASFVGHCATKDYQVSGYYSDVQHPMLYGVNQYNGLPPVLVVGLQSSDQNSCVDIATVLLQNWDFSKVGREFLEPFANSWASTGSLATARGDGKAFTLGNGTVIVVGGQGNNDATTLATCEVWDPGTGLFTPTGSMNGARKFFAGASLHGGAVLVASGAVGSSYDPLLTAETYDRLTGTWTPTGPVVFGSVAPSCVVLQNGQVLIVGGGVANSNASVTQNVATNAAQLYDPVTRTFSSVGPMTEARILPTLTRISPNEIFTFGAVLITGGSNNGVPSNTMELYLIQNVATGAGIFVKAGTLATARVEHQAVALNDGRILIVGGWDGVKTTLTSCEIIDPSIANSNPNGVVDVNFGTSLNSTFVASMRTPRFSSFVCTRLTDGTILVAGGNSSSTFNQAILPTNTVELFDPTTESWQQTDSMVVGRGNFFWAILNDGRVFITGGKSSLYPGGEITADLATSEIYTYATLPEVHKPIWTDMVNAFGFALSPGPIPTVFNGFQKLREAGPLVYPSEPETCVIPSQLFATTDPDAAATGTAFDTPVKQLSYTIPNNGVQTTDLPFTGVTPTAKFLFGFEPNQKDWPAGNALVSLYVRGGNDPTPTYTGTVHLYRGTKPFVWTQYDVSGATFTADTDFNLFTFTMPVNDLTGTATDYLYVYVEIVASVPTSSVAQVGCDGTSNFTTVTVPFVLSTAEPDTSLAVCYRLTDSDGRIWRSSPYILPNSLVWDATPVVIPPPPSPPTLVSLAISPTSATISFYGGSQPFTLTGTYSDGSTADVTDQASWSVSDPTKLRLGYYKNPSKAVAVAMDLASGVAIVLATLEGFSINATITINNSHLVSISLEGQYRGHQGFTMDLVPGISFQLVAMGTFADASVQDVSLGVYYTNDPIAIPGKLNAPITVDGAIATVSPLIGDTELTVSVTAGILNGGGGGTITSNILTVGVAGTATLTDITLSPLVTALLVGTTQDLTAIATFLTGPPTVTTFTIDLTSYATWSSSDPSVATVDANGKVTAVSEGIAVIFATYQAVAGSSSLSVYILTPQVATTAEMVRIPTLRHLMANTVAEIEFYVGQVDLRLYAVYPNDPTVPYLEVYPNAPYPGISSTGLQNTLKARVDANGLGETLYTTGGALENANPPIARCAAVWRNRAFVCNGNTICPSQEFADGLGIQWNEVTYIQWTDGTGDILACAPTDWNYLVFFKKDAVGVINGPGPDGAGNGNYIVQTLATKVGCSNVKSIVTAADGVYFQDSQTGRLMCLTTSLGAPTECAPGVFNLLDTASNSPTGAYPSPITCALHVEKDRQVWFFVGGHVKSLVVLDYKHRTERCPAGSVYTWPLSASVGAMCISQGFPMLVMKDGSMAFQSPGIWVDQLNPATGQGDQITMHVKSADHSPLGLQRQFDLSRVAFIGEFLTPHGLTLIVNPDFGIAGIPTSITISGPPEQVILRPARCMRIQAVSFDVQETITLDTENNPIVGPGFKFVGFALEVQDYGKIAMLSTGRLA